MGLLNFLKISDINSGLEEYDLMPQALLLDVRTPEEYHMGHIPGSRNLPLQSIDNVSELVHNKTVPLYVYCRSGARSRQATNLLRAMGYHYVKNIGGIDAYRGRVVS